MSHMDSYYEECDLAYDVACRRVERARVTFEISPASRRKNKARYARAAKPARKSSGMHRRGKTRHGV